MKKGRVKKNYHVAKTQRKHEIIIQIIVTVMIIILFLGWFKIISKKHISTHTFYDLNILNDLFLSTPRDDHDSSSTININIQT